jgi:hypothetical protein
MMMKNPVCHTLLYAARNLLVLLSLCAAVISPANAGVQVQSVTPVREAGKAILMTGFIVNKPAQSADLDDIAQGFPRELARRLEQSQQFSLRITPDFYPPNGPRKHRHRLYWRKSPKPMVCAM